MEKCVRLINQSERWLVFIYHRLLWKYTLSHLLLPSSGWWLPIVSYSHLLPPIDGVWFWREYWFLTKRQFKACVEQHQVESGVFGTTDLIISHDDLRIQCEPLPWTLLHTEIHTNTLWDEHDENKFWHIAENVLNYSISHGVGVVVSSEPHLTVGCSGGESTQCRPWCPRLTLCSTPLLSDPGPGG